MTETDYLLQDANKRIAELERDGAIKHDTIMRLHKRIGQLERQAENSDKLEAFVRKWALAPYHTFELAKEMTDLANELLKDGFFGGGP